MKDMGELQYFFGVMIIQDLKGGTVWMGQPSYTESILQKFNTAEAKPVKTPIKHILRYLVETTNYGLLYKRNSQLECCGYSDADWAGDIDDCKSTSGYVFQIGGAPVSWKSSKQSCVALSTTEAEYIALSTAAQEAIWLRRLLSELKRESMKPTTIYEDNQSAICLSKNPQFHGPKWRD